MNWPVVWLRRESKPSPYFGDRPNASGIKSVTEESRGGAGVRRKGSELICLEPVQVQLPCRSIGPHKRMKEQD